MTAFVNRTLMIALLVVCLTWLVVPAMMAVLWSLVDPSEPWTADKLFPPAMSFYRWQDMWENSALKEALINSYLLAPLAAVLTLALAAPTAFALGRYAFRGRETIKLLCLLPLVVPAFVTSIFFSSILFQLGFTASRFAAILFAHCVLFLPYAIRILSVSFEQVRDDHVMAARDLGATPFNRFTAAYLPALRSGIFAALLIVFIQSIEEFSIAFIIGSPDFITIPTLLFGSLGQDFVRPNAAVLALILVVPNVLLMLLLERFLRSANPALSSGKG